jgi:hypothetical protein
MSSGPPTDGPAADRRSRLARAAGLGLCLALLCLRRPGAVVQPQLWAEDGTVFFADAWLQGWPSLTEPYAGYLHTIQRLVALLACACGPALVPAVFVAAFVALAGWVAARALSERFPFRPRLAFALAVVLVPEVGEVLFSLANVQWVLAVGLLAVLLSEDARSRAGRAHDLAAAVLLGLTGPFSILFTPLFAWRACVRRSRASVVLAAAVAATALVQLAYLAAFMTAHDGPAQAPASDVHALAVVGARLGGSLLLGLTGLGDAAGVVAGIATIGGLAWLALHSGPERRERLWCGSALLVLLAATLWRCRSVLADLQLAEHAARYFFPLRVIAVWLVCTLLRERGTRRVVGALLLAAMLGTNLGHLRGRSPVDLRWSDYVARISAGEAMSIPIHPSGWSVVLPERRSRR